MKDIEKIKKDFEEKLLFAEIENKYSERLAIGTFVELSIVCQSFTQKGKIHGYFRNVSTIQNVGMILSLFPVTEKSRVYIGSEKYEQLDYNITVHRYPIESGTECSIAWIHDELDLTIKFFIDENDEDLMQYFKRTERQLEESEYSSFGIQKIQWRKRPFPFLTFNSGSVVKFAGGYHRQKSEGHAACLIETIKYKYEFNN